MFHSVTGEKIEQPHLKRIILLNKLTRWEVLCKEAQGNPNILSEMEMTFPGMKETHRVHSSSVNHILHVFKDIHNVDVEVVKAQSLSSIDRLDIDAVVSAGGDGTFLEAASLINFTPLACFCSSTDFSSTKCLLEKNSFNFLKMGSPTVEKDDSGKRVNVRNQPLWVFGLNTNPARSEGQLLLKSCELEKNHFHSYLPNNVNQDNYNKSTLSKQKSNQPFVAHSQINDIQENKSDHDHHHSLTKAIQRLVNRDYVPIQRRRLRVSIIETFRLSSQEVNNNVPLRTTCFSNDGDRLSCMDRHYPKSLQILENNNVNMLESRDVQPSLVQCHNLKKNYIDVLKNDSACTNSSFRLIEYRSVNDVFLTNSQNNRTLYVELSVDDNPPFRSKNSGVLICTGSGSTAWAFNMSRIEDDAVESIRNHLLSNIPSSVLKNSEIPSTSSLKEEANAKLIFDPQELRMRFVLREPINNRVFRNSRSCGFCKRIKLTPLTVNTCLYFDGLGVMPLQYGQSVCIEIGHEEDCLLTAV
ncbi:NAD kinase 2, mitochondrial-like [Hylaeus volcanicus]|uniref:NAD kinase 2, mitochondrial-like n=1 Tax=Hylaeus volcanicus TaxID=313075 RepID=UPI0023B86794|nr:NAD kinase 2, mitochondrial-like [Hylaeus volcanicus]